MVFGWLALKLVDWLPALSKILPVLGSIGDWFIDVGGVEDAKVDLGDTVEFLKDPA